MDSRCRLFAVFVAAVALGCSLAPQRTDAAPCPDCFAVFVMPDTQFYTHDSRQPQGADHLDLMTRWICQYRNGFTEPSTGKEMPIVMVVHLGDLVQSGDRDLDNDGIFEEWERVSNAFARLDDCASGPVPYLVTTGNHDYATVNDYASDTQGYHAHFGAQRWQASRCSDPADCDWLAGEYFVGWSDPILANSRNNLSGTVGPPIPQPGRHRAGVIRVPNGQRWLFLGLEAGFDFPPQGHPSEQDDLAWPKQVLADYEGVHTVLFHHALLGPTGVLPLDEESGSGFGSDSITGTEDWWNEIAIPYPQISVAFNGHWTGYLDENEQFVSVRETDLVMPTSQGLSSYLYFRNYQQYSHASGSGQGCPNAYGGGWNVIAVFDPEDEEIRVRSYRIDDTDDDCTNDGTPAAPTALDLDILGPELVRSYAFTDTRPASFDNCPSASNPNQLDTDGDGIGDACETGGGGPSCGLGVELMVLLPALFWAFPRGRRARFD